MSRFLRIMLVGLLLCISLLVSGPVWINAQNAVPTLIPPTPIPRQEVAVGEMLPSNSAVGRIQETGVVRIGILYNAPPFAELNIRGELSGFDADLSRMMAETWGVEAEFTQITRDLKSVLPMLRNGTLDFLIGGQVNHRSNASTLEYSQTYYLGGKAVMVRSEDTAPGSPSEFGQRQIGVVIASPAEQSARAWLQRSGLNAGIHTFLTLDEAYHALISRDIDGVIDSRTRLNHISQLYPEGVRILDETIDPEPYAIAVLRQDLSMRLLINRTLQFLTVTDQIQALYQTYFPGQAFQAVDVWGNVGEAPGPADFPASIEIPGSFVVGRFASDPVLRVAGLIGVTVDSEATESQRRLDSFHRQLVEEMASRWGVTVEFIPDSYANAVELVQAGQADIAVGIAPDWNLSQQVDFTSHYLRHGPRLMIPIEDVGTIAGFGDLSGSLIITPNNEPDTIAYARTIAERGNWRLDFTQQSESDLAFVLLGGNEDEEIRADAVFADSLKLVPLVQGNPGSLALTRTDTDAPRWYAPTQRDDQDFGYQMMAFALPHNDVDFRLLVEMTLQELVRDGNLQELLALVMLDEDVPDFEIWPGESIYLNFSLAG